MAIGAITVVDRVDNQIDNAALVSFAGDDSYPTGGTADFQEAIRDALEAYELAKSDANVRGRSNVTILRVSAHECGQYLPWYDATNDKLYVKDGGSATLAEVGNGVSLAAVTFKMWLSFK